MRDNDCAWVRDRLPERLDGRLDDLATARMGRHLETCEDCRAESALVERLRIPVRVPAGLETRVLRAVHAESPPAAIRMRRLPATRHFAMAATVVFALVTASLLRDSTTGPAEDPFGTDLADAGDMVWSAYADPLLPGSAGLHSLSVDELELVLQELER